MKKSMFPKKMRKWKCDVLEWINPSNLVNPCFGKDDLWIKLWVLFTFVSPIPTRRTRRFYLCFPCFPCDSIKPRRGFQISSIRSIVPQELVFIKTYPFGMIKQIQRIYGIYGLFCLKIYLFDFGKICTIWLRRAKGSARRALPPYAVQGVFYPCFRCFLCEKWGTTPPKNDHVTSKNGV